MNYFFDCEFIEGFHKPLFGKRRHFIDLISIGIVCEDGRTYEAISKEYNYNDADKWVKENVILPLYTHTCSGDKRNHFYADNFHKYFGKSNNQIAREIREFCLHPYKKNNGDGSITVTLQGNPEFYGYYSDYDWVLLCSLFGRMIDLPKGFPMYCIDLKQMLDEKAGNINQLEMTGILYGETNWKAATKLPKQTISIDDYGLLEKIELLKSDKYYPKQTNEHNALADAKWNYELYKFLTK